MLTYEDALQQVLDAASAGEDVDAAIARFPEHASALREDVRLSEAVAALANAARAPRAESRVDASRRMMAQLEAERAAASKPRWSFGRALLPRYALAAAVVALAVVGAGLVLDNGGNTVEAATIEGVVVENQDGMLTVQTLTALEHVRVPRDAPVSDVAGASIGLGGIEIGQIVVIDAQRRGKDVVAQRVRRFLESIEAWCTDDSARCRSLSAGLEQAKRQCERLPSACRVAMERLEGLRLRASDSARLEELKQRCRGGDDGSCRQIVSFCRDHAVLCGGLAPAEAPGTDRPLIGNRLRALFASCLIGDEAACRQLAQACDQYGDLCPVDLLPPPDASPRVDSSPDASSRDVAPSVTPTVASDVRPAAGLTPERPAEAPGSGDAGPAPTPAHDAEATPVRDAEAPPVEEAEVDASTLPTDAPMPEPAATAQPEPLRDGDAPVSDR